MFSGVQFPKDAIEWITKHHELASWLEAIGVIAGIFISVWTVRAGQREQQRTNDLKAYALAHLLQLEVLQFSGQLGTEIARGTFVKAVKAPTILWNRVDDMYLLGEAGKLIMIVLGSLDFVNDVIARRNVYDKASFDADTSIIKAMLANAEVNMKIASDELSKVTEGTTLK